MLKLYDIQSKYTKYIHRRLAPQVATNWKICDKHSVRCVQNRIVCMHTQNWKQVLYCVLHLHPHPLCILSCIQPLKFSQEISYTCLLYSGSEKERLAPRTGSDPTSIQRTQCASAQVPGVTFKLLRNEQRFFCRVTFRSGVSYFGWRTAIVYFSTNNNQIDLKFW